MKRATTLIPFAGSQLNETRDVCAFFKSDEEYRVSGSLREPPCAALEPVRYEREH
jgi:hypothetical protein